MDYRQALDAGSPKSIKAFLEVHGISPRKRFGQNFLHDRNVAARIVRACSLKKGERVAEIGPGLGALTLPLLRAGVRLTCFELDRRLEPALEPIPGVKLIWGDFLKLPLPRGSRLCGCRPHPLIFPIAHVLPQRTSERIRVPIDKARIAPAS